MATLEEEDGAVSSERGDQAVELTEDGLETGVEVEILVLVREVKSEVEGAERVEEKAKPMEEEAW